MGKVNRRSTEDVAKMVEEFERSGLNRHQYCERRGIAVATLDWYRRRVRTGGIDAGLVPVRIETMVPMHKAKL